MSPEIRLRAPKRTEEEKANRREFLQQKAIKLLTTVAQPDPKSPDDQGKFKFGGVKDPRIIDALGGSQFSGDPRNEIIAIGTSYKSILFALQNPDKARSDARERAFTALRQVKIDHPRFAEMPDGVLIALLASRLKSYRHPNQGSVDDKPNNTKPIRSVVVDASFNPTEYRRRMTFGGDSGSPLLDHLFGAQELGMSRSLGVVDTSDPLLDEAPDAPSEMGSLLPPLPQEDGTIIVDLSGPAESY